jgi:hypothetical protein
MALVNRNYVKTDSNNPLEAYIEGKGYKAYLVANLAFNDSPQGSTEHYNLSLAEVYSAMAFYHANEGGIETSLKEAHEGLLKLGMRDGDEVLAEIRARQKK